MHILIVNNSLIPAQLYGGTERVIWGLAKELHEIGHQVSFLVKKGSSCSFATIIPINESLEIVDQIPNHVDLVHFNFPPANLEKVTKPYLITMHGNSNDDQVFDKNTVFVSKNHAERYGSEIYVHNGLNWDDYSKPNLMQPRQYFHFLGKAAWRIKNVKGAINIIKQTKKERLKVLGGVRFNVSMGLRFTFTPRVQFYGMVGGAQKDQLLNGSKGLIFPVRWHEPFGLAIIESLYFGCPVFGTPYGSLPELVTKEFGLLSNKASDLLEAIEQSQQYNPNLCHEYAVSEFNSKIMTQAYLEKYEKVLAGQKLNAKAPKLKEIQQEKFLPWVE